MSASDFGQHKRYCFAQCNNEKPPTKTLSSFVVNSHIGSKTQGSYILTASYTDMGGGVIKGLNAQQTFLLRYPKIEAETFDEGTTQKMNVPAGTAPGIDEELGIAIGLKDSYFMFKELDLTGVRALRGRFAVAAGMMKGGDVEFRLDDQDGELLGKLTIEVGLTEFGLKELQVSFNKTVTGKHDLYVVFGSEEAEEGALVAVADWFEFLNTQLP